jgi:phage shock protein A
MSGRLMDRVASLIRAGLGDLSDPPAAGTASPRTSRIDAALADVREQLGQAIARRHQLEKARRAALQDSEAVASRAAVAIAVDREDLARAALEHQAETAGLSAAMDEDLASLSAEIAQLELLAEQLAAARRELTGEPANAAQPAPARNAKLAELDELVARAAADQTHRQKGDVT